MDVLGGPDRLGARIVEALGIKENLVRRLILDCQACKPPVVYIEADGDDAMYDLNWELLLRGAEIKTLEEQFEGEVG